MQVVEREQEHGEGCVAERLGPNLGRVSNVAVDGSGVAEARAGMARPALIDGQHVAVGNDWPHRIHHLPTQDRSEASKHAAGRQHASSECSDLIDPQVEGEDEGR